jgi:hypothetical protein
LYPHSKFGQYGLAPCFIKFLQLDPHTQNDFVFPLFLCPGPTTKNAELCFKTFHEEINSLRNGLRVSTGQGVDDWEVFYLDMALCTGDYRWMPGLTCHRQLPSKHPCHHCDVTFVKAFYKPPKRGKEQKQDKGPVFNQPYRWLSPIHPLLRQPLELANGILSDSEIEIDAQAEEDDSDSEDNEDENQEEAQHQDQDPRDPGSEESESDESKREESESDDDSDDDSDIEEERDEYNNGLVPNHDLQSDENQSSDEEQNDEDPHLLPPPKKTTNAIIFARGEKIEQLVGNKRQKTN